MSTSGIWRFVVLTACLLLFIIGVWGDSDKLTKRSFRSRQRNMRNPFSTSNRQLLMNLYNTVNESHWSRMYIPDVPTGDEIDCYIEVEVVQVVGGRCVRLAGSRRMAVCQSGMYLDVRSNECQYILAAREMENAMRAQEQDVGQQNTDSSSTRTDLQTEQSQVEDAQ